MNSCGLAPEHGPSARQIYLPHFARNNNNNNNNNNSNNNNNNNNNKNKINRMMFLWIVLIGEQLVYYYFYQSSLYIMLDCKASSLIIYVFLNRNFFHDCCLSGVHWSVCYI